MVPDLDGTGVVLQEIALNATLNTQHSTLNFEVKCGAQGRGQFLRSV